jgi:hypothetical protein
MPTTVVGVISDTHGLLRPEAVDALRGSNLIIHAGDVGDQAILGSLEAIAPVHAIRGKADVESWSASLPDTQVVEAGGLHLYVLHDLHKLDLKPSAAGFAAVVSGHSHQPKQEVRNGVLYFNPGSAGPKRFKLPVSLGKLTITNGRVRAELMTLQV